MIKLNILKHYKWSKFATTLLLFVLIILGISIILWFSCPEEDKHPINNTGTFYRHIYLLFDYYSVSLVIFFLIGIFSTGGLLISVLKHDKSFISWTVLLILCILSFLVNYNFMFDIVGGSLP